MIPLNFEGRFSSWEKCWELVDHLQGSLRPSGPETPKKSEKSLKKVSRGLRGPPRVWKKSRKSLSGPFRDFFQTLQTFSRLFSDFTGSLNGCPRKWTPNRPFLSTTSRTEELSIPVLLILISWGVPTTPDPNTSAKVSRYKWEPYRDTSWWCIYYFLPRGGHTCAKVSR